MSTIPPALGRPADRKNSILDHLRREIADGTWLPGCQLPTRSEIGDQFGASPVTVQSALQHLRQDGFVVVRGRHGTYVAPHPPHLTNYALVFTSSPDEPSWTPFWTSLAGVAKTPAVHDRRNISLYFNVNRNRHGDDYRRLEEDVRARKLAGIIFATNPYEVRDTPLLDEPGIARVAIMSRRDGYLLPYVRMSESSFWDQALSHIRDRGRQRVALISTRHLEDIRVAVERARTLGLHTEPRWTHSVARSNPETARSLMQLLFHSGQAERPDALVIADDNLLEESAVGLALAGVRVPEDLKVVAHCNLPHPSPCPIAALRLGVDAFDVIAACLAALDAHRTGEKMPQCTVIKPRFAPR